MYILINPLFSKISKLAIYPILFNLFPVTCFTLAKFMCFNDIRNTLGFPFIFFKIWTETVSILNKSMYYLIVLVLFLYFFLYQFHVFNSFQLKFCNLFCYRYFGTKLVMVKGQIIRLSHNSILNIFYKPVCLFLTKCGSLPT